MRRPPYLSLAIAAAAVLLLSVVLFRRYLPYVGGQLAPKEPPAVVLQMDDTYLVGLGRNGKTWSVKAEKVEVGRNRATTTITGVTDGKVFEGRNVILKMRAGRAIYDSGAQALQLFGGVRVESRTGQVVEAQGAYLDEATTVLRSSGKVAFRSRWGGATADGVVVDLRKRELAMRNVSGWASLGELQKEQAAGQW